MHYSIPPLKSPAVKKYENNMRAQICCLAPKKDYKKFAVIKQRQKSISASVISMFAGPSVI
jgi:hypothetical protein